jgi:CHAT domain-containing protein
MLRQVVEAAPISEEKVLALRNLALIQQAQGDLVAAAAAIAQAEDTLAALPSAQQLELQASLLDVKGAVQLAQGQGSAAIATWQQAIDLYTELSRPEAIQIAQINQAQAMQQMGFHRQALTTLRPVVVAQASQPDSVHKATALRLFGESSMQAGNLSEAQESLLASQAIATTLQDAEGISATALSLGNLSAIQGDTPRAQNYYETATAQPTATVLTRTQAALNRLDLLIQSEQTATAQREWAALLTTLNSLPVNQAVLFAKIHLATALIPIANRNPTPQQLADILVETIQHAQALGDRRSESFALGTLGHLYETLEQWEEAAQVSQAALVLAQEMNANDITYRWQWQLGRIYEAEKQSPKAIVAYSEAVKTLQRLRTDLVAVNPAVQVSFQENVEPIHRDLVSLLLAADRTPTPADLATARDTIESLQLAELDNFFREACLDAAQIDIDQLDQRAAVIYPVILSDHLEIIVSLPGQALQHYTAPVTAADFNRTVEQFQQLLVLRVGQQFMPHGQQLYDWMIRPLLADLASSEIDTLVFVLDGELRNIPMAALHNGSQFLLEEYSIAIAPGLQLVNPRPIQNQNIRVLTAGLSEARQGFSALPNVVTEVAQIQATVPAAVLLNDGFTIDALSNGLNTEGTPIVHLASHGKFSSTNEGTFVLTWEDRLEIADLNNLLQTAELNQEGPIELLVLSACQTAAGDIAVCKLVK